MSIRAMSWALNEAPVEEPTQVLILVAMAERAADDGTDTFQSIRTIAEKARVSPRTVQRELPKLEAAGIIRRGNQAIVETFRGDRRPVVYDLNMSLRRGDRMSPREEGHEATPTTPRTEPHGATSATSRHDTETPRHDTVGSHGTTRTAHNTSLTRPLNSSTNSGETSGPQELALPGVETRATAIAVPPEQPLEAVLAKRAYDNTNGALPYMGMMKISQSALKRGYAPAEIEQAIATLWRGGRAVTQQSVGQALEGIIRPGGRTRQTSTTDQRVQAGMDLTEKYRQQEQLEGAGQ